MMQPFEGGNETGGFSASLLNFLATAAGNCSILMRTPAGCAVYLYWHDNPGGPMIYGPIAKKDIFVGFTPEEMMGVDA